MNQYFLKFTDKAQAIEVGLLNAVAVDGEITKQTGNYFIDAIGAITKTTPTGVNENGEQIFTTQELDGYHVNLLIDELPSGLDGYRVMPTTPFRCFAGV